ncbi:MAG TPA: ectoine hydroxylase [Mycobacteriales bacterium]|nr:ectoine hydroxylase [Mycobacteriales bacterium]
MPGAPTAASPAVDRYPTRVAGTPRNVPRTDPVVYRRGAGPLSTAQLDRFETDGFVLLDELLRPDEVDAALREVDRMATDPVLRRSERVITEPDGDEVRSVFEVHLASPLLAGLIADGRLAGLARQVLGSDVYVHQSRVNRKPGFVGREFSWHSDFETWHAEDGMPAARAVSLSVALTPNYVCNGSLMLIPGSHRTFVATQGETPSDHYRESLRRQQVGVPDENALSTLVDQAGGITTATGAAGSAVLFDCNVMHGSSSNITPYPRCNLFVVYNSVDNPLQEPFAAPARRPEFIASRSFQPLR